MSVEVEHGPKHDFHLVDPSPWPACAAASAGLLAFGLVLFMHPDLFGVDAEEFVIFLGPWAFFPGAILLCATAALWWRDVTLEAERGGHHTPIVQLGMRYGMALFIVSEVMFFGAFFWAFFNARLYPKETPVDVPGGVWPPEGIETLDAFDVPFLNTLILLLSGVTVTWAHHALREGHRREMLQALGITVMLGFTFTSLQIFEYAHANFAFTDGIYASTFYLATGFHGFHVVVGTVFLAVCWYRAANDHFKPDHHFGFEAAAWYWHFVDAVWLFLFVCVYWLGG
jgi:cytochrome c oxidase subunit III